MYLLSFFHNIQMRVFILLTILFLLSHIAAPQVAGCLLTVPGTLQCQICLGGLQLDDLGNCKLYTPIEGCLVYNSSTNGASCVNCTQGYLLSGAICLQMIPNCASTNNVNTCDQCSNGYTLIRYSNCYSTNVSSCPLGTLPRTVNGATFCQQYNVLNCQTSTPDGASCATCTQRFTAINGVCFTVQNTVPCQGNSCNCQGAYFGNNCYTTQLSNCLQTTDNIYCTLCSDQYFLSKGVCLKYIKNNDINCNVLASDGVTCAGCNLDYFLNSDFICTKNFQLCPNGCTTCPWNGFTLFNGNCYNQDPLCLVYDFDKQTCQLCTEGYAIDPFSLACVKAVSCLTRDANNFCTKCFSGFQLDYTSYQCVQLPTNCAFMNTSSQVCLNCTPSTSFNNNICVFATSNCQDYDTSGYCQTCISGYVQVTRTCLPISPNCQTYNSVDQSKCTTCMAGFRLSGQQCSLIITGCLVYSSTNACISCSQGYLLANGGCFFNDPNCLSQDSNGLCQQCQNGYLPFKGNCVYYDPYCLAYDPSSMVCTQASSAFSLGDFSLQQRLSYLNFVMQVASFAQNSASADFIGSSGQGSYTKSGFITSLPYAGLRSASIASYDMNGNILTCQQGYSLVNAQCVILSQNCMTYNQFNTCQQCNPGFDLLANNTCATRSSATCIKQAGGICLQAASGYVLIGGAAFFAGNNINQVGANGLIASASNGYFLWSASNIAWPYDFNCVQQSQPGKCQQCVSSQFTLSNGKCVLLKSNCIAYSPYGLCMGCQGGFMLWAGECRRASCNGFDVSTGFCKACPANYTLSLGFCSPRQISNCQMYNGIACLFCQSGYYLTSGGLCAKMISFCQTASPQTGRCSQCVYNYTIYQEQCIPQILNCQVYTSSLNACATCNTLYYPIASSTVCAYLGFYCATMNDAGQCITCNPGLTLTTQNQTKICIRPISNCFSYDASIKCVICNSGYVLQYNKCKSIRCSSYNYTLSSCTGCSSTFVLTNGSCLDPNCAKNILEMCLSCLPRFYLSGTTCILSPDPNCLNYSSAGYCLKCLENYTLNDKGICVSSDVLFYGCSTRAYPCPKCAVGYFLNGPLCYARRCSSYKSNRDCQACINYYTFQPTQRFCIIYTCASPPCYESDAPPAGFYADSNGSLRISSCVLYNGASCGQCQNYRYPNPSILYNLCYPYNCMLQTILNCSANCLSYYAATLKESGGCLATNCLNWDSTGRCLQCGEGYQLISNSYCVRLIIPFCQTINYATSTCSVCISGFDLYQGFCRSSNCNIYSTANSSICGICANGYQFDSNSFICKVGKCSQVSPRNLSQCLKCLLGYSLQGVICFANNCANYDWSSLTCITCLPSYDLVNGIGICKAKNCNNYDENLICTSCLNTTNNVYALRGGVCISVDPNCISFDSNGNCLACNNPSIYINAGQLCILIVQGCQKYNTSGCISCLPAYSYSNGICQVLYCSSYAAPFKCSACLARYQLQNDFTCIPKNCITFNSQTWACQACQPRFQLINSLFCFTYNCSAYSVSNYVCTKCAAGFTLAGEACLFANCPTSNQFTCPSCVTGFQLIGGVCQAPKDNCTQYDANSYVCLRCAQGFNLTALGICVFVQLPDPYCVSYDPQSGNCTKCLPTFTYNTQANQCQSNFCSQFNNAQQVRGRVCVACVSGFILDPSNQYCISVYCQGYTLSTGVCISCIAGTSLVSNVCYALNCATYSNQYPLSPFCLTCAAGYSLAGTICRSNNCQTYNTDFSCQFCSAGYALGNNGTCISTQCNPGFVFQNFVCVPANCLNYTSSGCIECLPGFVQQRQSCVADSCLTFNNQYVCLTCRQGYNLTLVNGQYLCILIIQPTCPRGYFLSAGSCIAITISNCSIVDSSGSTCLHCLDSFFLYNGICYAISGCQGLSFISGCYTCILGFYLQGNLCISLNCQNVYPNNTCISCISGYTLVGGTCKAAIYKCLQSDSQGNCLRCMDNFQLTQGHCVAVGCSSYSLSSYICLSCAASYYLNGQICILRVVIPNCYTALNSTYCSQCSNGYVQLNGNCYLQVQFCVSYNPANGACAICTTGYYLNNNFICIILSNNCLSASSNGVCTNCAAGYIAASGQCVAGTAFCQSFDPSTALCLRCIQGYYLTSNNRCVLLPQFCLSAAQNGSCLSCKGGYSVAAGICVVTIDNCVIYNQNNPNYCYQCTQAYYLNAVYSCSILPPFCLAANNLGWCLNCLQGYQLFSSGLCVIFVPNCITYIQLGSNGTRCSQCATSFTLTNNFTCSSLPKNCLSADNFGACVQCVSGYQVYSSFCVIRINYCVSYDSNSFFCSGCANGYYLFLSGGGYICQALPSYCLAASVAGTCQTCIANYIIYNGICVLYTSILNCQSYNLQSYVCLSCIQGYYLSGNNICTVLPSYCYTANPNGVCLSCLQGYQLSNGNCVLYVINCAVYNYASGTCTQCAPGYSLSQDLTTCSLMVTNCQVFNPTGICLQCMAGYYLINGYCFILPQGCSQLNNQQVCVSCLSQYTLVKSVCVFIIANCAFYNISGCYQCNQFYYLYNAQCIIFPSNCLSFDTGLLRCINCASGFTLNPNTYVCSKTVFIANCQSYNAQGQCINCLPRYYLRQNSCWQYPSYCVNVDFAGNCLSCAFGSTLQNGGCVATSGRSLNCRSFNSATNLCITCMSGYNFCSISGICVLPDPGCLTLNNDGSCQQCKSAYQLFQGKCLQYPTGLIIAPNGGVSCASGYEQQNNSCFRSAQQLTTLSSNTYNFLFAYSSNGLNSAPIFGSSVTWSPSKSQLNQYLSIQIPSGNPQIIFQVGLRGAPQGWVSGYVIQFKNRADAPFICWNSCNQISGNSDGQTTSSLRLYHPIIATEIRIYPVAWVRQINLQVELWIQTYQ